MFFDAQQQALADRGRQLQARSAALRGQVAVDADVLRTPLALADQVRGLGLVVDALVQGLEELQVPGGQTD